MGDASPRRASRRRRQVLGASLVATSAVVMEAAVECTHPTSPEVSTGLLFCGGNVVSVASTYVFQALLARQGGRCQPLGGVLRGRGAPVALFLVANVLVSASLLASYRGPSRRLEAERARSISAGGAPVLLRVSSFEPQ